MGRVAEIRKVYSAAGELYKGTKLAVVITVRMCGKGARCKAFCRVYDMRAGGSTCHVIAMSVRNRVAYEAYKKAWLTGSKALLFY